MRALLPFLVGVGIGVALCTNQGRRVTNIVVAETDRVIKNAVATVKAPVTEAQEAADAPLPASGV